MRVIGRSRVVNKKALEDSLQGCGYRQDQAPKLAFANRYDADGTHSLRGGDGDRQCGSWEHGEAIIRKKEAFVKIPMSFSETSRYSSPSWIIEPLFLNKRNGFCYGRTANDSRVSLFSGHEPGAHELRANGRTPEWSFGLTWEKKQHA
jgi:hypothetical protein